MSEYLGLYQAIVVDNNDPLKQGRVTCLVPQVLGSAKTDWAAPQLPTVSSPAQGEIVYMQFLNGDPAKPVYHGAYAVSAQNVIAGSLTAATIAAHSITVEKLTVTSTPLIPNAGFDEMSQVTTTMPSYWTSFLYFGTNQNNYPTMSFDATNVRTAGNALKISMTNSLIPCGGDFEGGTSAWSSVNASQAYATGAAYVYSGTYSLKLTSMTSGTPITLLQNIDALFTAGDQYTFIVNAEADPSSNPVQIGFQLQWYDSSNNNIGSPVTFTSIAENQTDGTTANFSTNTYSAVAPAGAWGCQVEVIFGDTTMTAGQIHYVDQIQIIQQQCGVILSDAVPVTPGEWVQTTFWAKADQNTEDGLAAALWFSSSQNFTPDLNSGATYPNVWHPFSDSFDASNNVLYAPQGFSTSWTKMTARTQVPTGMTWMRMTIGTNPGTYTGNYNVWIDDGNVDNNATGNIQSVDYVPGSSGWALNDDGTASQIPDLSVLTTLGVGSASTPGVITSNNVQAQAASQYVADDGSLQNNADANGNPVVPSMETDWLDASYQITAAAAGFADYNTVLYNGQTADAYFAANLNFPQCVYWSELGPTSYGTANVGASNVLLCTTTIGTLTSGHLYNVKVRGQINPTTAGDGAQLWLVYTNNNSSPATTSTALPGSQVNYQISNTRNQSFYIDWYGTFTISASPIKIGLVGYNNGTGTFYLPLAQATTPMDIAVFDLGPVANVQGTIAQKSVSTGGTATSGDGSGGSGSTTTKTYTKTVYPVWTQSYDGDGGKRAGGDGGYLYQGYYDGTHGNQKSLWKFGDLSGTLSGSTVTKVTLTFHCTHTYYNSGASARIGYSTYSGGVPGSFPGHTYLQSKSVVAGNTYTVTLNSSCYGGIKSGSIQEIVFGPGSTNSRDYYAIFSGSPHITVTYKK